MHFPISRAGQALCACALTAALLCGVPQACDAATANQSGVPKNVPAQPAQTGTMYNGNNTAPSNLTLHGPLAPITEALESNETAAPGGNGEKQQTNANLGGKSGNSRSGGGG